MIIHFSILGVILFTCIFFEKSNKEHALSCLAENEPIKTRFLPWFLIFGYIAFLAAMRSGMNDTGAYIHSFNNLEASWQAFWNQVSSAGEGKDWAFGATNILLKMIVADKYHWWFAFYAVIESFAFIYILRRYSVSIFDACFFFFCSTLYYNYFSMMRQWFAIAILFAASRFIENKKFLKYLLVCVFAAQFHASAYFMIPVYFIVQGKPWSQKQLTIIGIFAVAMIFLNPLLDAMEKTLADTTYDYAISAMNSDSGSSIVRAFIAAVPVVFAYMYKDNTDNPMINICVNMSLLNLLLNILAAFTSGLFIIRMSTYVGVYNTILYPYLLNVSIKGKDRDIIKPLFYIIYLAFYVYQMKYQGSFGYGSDILGYYH